MNAISIVCRAKINLTLDVLDRRPDGFHNIASVMQSIDLCDRIRIETRSDQEVVVECSVPDLDCGRSNTVYQACVQFKKTSNLRDGMTVSLTKHIPMQAGLGGGSSDAAGVLLALNRLYGQTLTQDELLNLAATIGSDVPFFIVGGTAYVRGRGEIVERAPDAPVLHLVVVKPDCGVSTAWAYGRLAALQYERSPRRTLKVVEAIRQGDRSAMLAGLSNDFDGVAASEFTDVSDIKAEMIALGAERALLCGSGSAVFGAFGTRAEAESAAKKMAVKWPFAAAVDTISESITIIQ